MIVASWSAIFKKELLCKNHILFDESIKNGEDWLFQVQAIFHAERVITIDYIGYNYYVGGEDACSTQLNAEKIIESFEAFNKALECIQGNKDFHYYANKGYCNLLNYSVSNFGYQRLSFKQFQNERKLIVHTIPFKIGTFCFSNYSKFAYFKITMFYSKVLSPIMFFAYNLKNVIKLHI